MRNFFIFSLLFVCGSAHGQERIDFREALKRALSKAPQFQSLVLSEKNAELAEKNAWTSLLPTLDLQALHSYTQRDGDSSLLLADPNARYPWASQFGVSINQNFYDNGDSWRQIKTTRLQRQLEALNLAGGRSRFLVSIAKSYFDYSLASGVVELQRKQIESLRSQFRTIETRYQQGIRSNRDYLRIKAQLQSSEIGLLNQQVALQNQRAELNTLLGEISDVDFIPLAEPSAQLTKMTKLSLRVEDTFEYRTAQIQDEISDLAYEASRRTQWPRLSLKADYNYIVPQYMGPRMAGLDEPYWNFQAMLVLDYRLWDWGRSSRSVQIAENQKRIQMNTQQVSRLQIQQNVFSLQKQAELLQRSLEMSSQILRANEAAYVSLNRGYIDGKVSYLELITALNDFYSSRSQDLNLRYSILRLRADLAHVQGNIDELLENF